MTNPILLSDIANIHKGLEGRHDRFRNATLVVTGCAGFLGFYFMNYFVRFARELGLKKVIGLDTFFLDKPVWLGRLAEEFPGVLHLQTFDISKDNLTDVPGAPEARYVLHMASIASPTFYRQFPLETIDGNIWGLRRLLDFYQGSKDLAGFLFFSSSEIYGDPDADHIPTSEDYRGNVACVGPRACYDESKRFGETLCHVFSTTKATPITVARPFNNYGPGMRLGDKRLPADLARCVLDGTDIILYSNGAPKRTFCYITDAITGYILCLLHPTFDAFNIGIEKPEITVQQLAEIYRAAGKDVLGYEGNVRFEVSEDKEYLSHNPQRRCPTITKAREILGYNPQIFVEEGVHRYLEFLSQEKKA